MKRTLSVLAAVCCLAPVSADPVLEWNAAINQVIQQDGTHPVHKANPGWSTRSMAMMNGAIYDAYQAVNRTHTPYVYNSLASDPANTSVDAAVHQAARDLLAHCYPGEVAMIDSAFNSKMASVPVGLARDNGVALGQQIAQAYIAARAGDNSDVMVPYMPGTNPGEWRPDPWNPGQQAWGPGWGAVAPFGIPASQPFVDALPGPPALNSPEYTAAFNQVRDYGALVSAQRTQDMTEIGLFWAYDRPSIGPPPVLFVRNLEEIGAQAGLSPEENARLFAMASVAQADAAIAAWDAKFEYNFWRPVGGIQEAGVGGPGDNDGNPDTVGITDWKPLGAPGADPNSDTDDFTPPFPSWTSGHATMGAAVFKTLELFFGTNNFDEIDGILGNNPDYVLTSQEAGSGGSRTYQTFTQMGPLVPGGEDSPEGENAMSRVYLGIHWIFDQADGTTLGHDIAGYVNSNLFRPIPEPSSLALVSLGAVALALVGLRRRA